MLNGESQDRFDEAAARILGPVYDRIIEGVDVYLAGVDDLVMKDVTVTVRESAGLPGWIGVVDADLSQFGELKLELRLPVAAAECAIMFVVGGEILGRTLIRGAGRTPGETPKVRSRPRVTPMPREVAETLDRSV